MSTNMEKKPIKKDNGIEVKVSIPQGVEVSLDNSILHIKGKEGEVTRNLTHPYITMKKENNIIEIKSKGNKKRFKKILYTLESHVKNLLNGVLNPYIYKLKICAGHFPINVKQEGKKISISNFLGEKIPRLAKILDNVKVKIEGEFISVQSVDLESAGQTAANLEIATVVRARDRRIFQDGIFIIEKPN